MAGVPKSYTGLAQLRQAIPIDIPLFGCTATLTAEAEEFVLHAAGFRPIGRDIGQLEVIRTPVDRPTISIVVQCLERGALKDYRRLSFLLDKKPGQDQILKTIVYIDSKKALIDARHYLMKALCSKGEDHDMVSRIISRYDADVRPCDQQRLYDEFRREDSTCRSMLATVSLGMGMDIPDVKRVVQFGTIKSGDMADLWQRFGRAVRAGGFGIAYYFAPYWWFDKLGLAGGQASSPRSPASGN